MFLVQGYATPGSVTSKKPAVVSAVAFDPMEELIWMGTADVSSPSFPLCRFCCAVARCYRPPIYPRFERSARGTDTGRKSNTFCFSSPFSRCFRSCRSVPPRSDCPALFCRVGSRACTLQGPTSTLRCPRSRTGSPWWPCSRLRAVCSASARTVCASTRAEACCCKTSRMFCVCCVACRVLLCNLLFLESFLLTRAS